MTRARIDSQSPACSPATRRGPDRLTGGFPAASFCSPLNRAASHKGHEGTPRGEAR
jgi:hypothetical protein